MNSFTHPRLKVYILTALGIILGLVLVGCNSPLPQFTYQGVLTDAGGNPLDGNIAITYNFYNTETGGTALYSETETVTVTDGRFDSIVGPGAIVADLTPEDLAQALWVELQVDDGTYVETLTPRQRLYGSPYAFTLMPGAVISSAMDESLFGANGISAVISIQNTQETDPIPALRVVGEQGLELVDVSDTHGTIYSDLDNASSDLQIHSNDNLQFFLNTDGSGETSDLFMHGYPVGNWCRMTHLGSFSCTGGISTSRAVNGENRSLYMMQSPEVRVEDFGSAQLSKGKATVKIDPLFAQTASLEIDYYVFLTPLGDCNGLYVTNKTAAGFEVHEQGGGISDIQFDYRIVAKQTGYEDVRMEVVDMGDEGLGQ